MSMQSAAFVFFGALLLSTISSLVLAARLDQLGAWLGLSEALLGIITALGADAPEISSAITALVGHHGDLGLGVVLGSNVFNLAALLGVSALIAGRVQVGRRTLTLESIVALWITLAVMLQLLAGVSPVWTLALIATVGVPYIVIAAIRPEQAARLPLPRKVAAQLSATLAEATRDARTGHTPHRPSAMDLLGIVPALAAVVLASVGMVSAAEVLGRHWHVGDAVMGTLVLATLTGIPNLVAAIRLALHHRGSAVLSESFNSNTLNLVIGVTIPSLFFAASATSREANITLVWLFAMFLLSIALCARFAGLTRLGGMLLIGAYVVFVATTIHRG